MLIDEMKRLEPVWVEVFNTSQVQRDFDIAVQNCDNEHVARKSMNGLTTSLSGKPICGACAIGFMKLDWSHFGLFSFGSNPASTPDTSRRTGRDGSQNFSLQDKLALLDAIEQAKPTSPAKWDQLREVMKASRDVAALRRKFNQMVNLPKPTGDSTCPSDVRRAKELSRAINESFEMARLSDDEILKMTEERAADAADDGQFDTGPGNSSSGRRSSDTPWPSSVASATPGNGREHASQSRKSTRLSPGRARVSVQEEDQTCLTSCHVFG
ncbi:hypothetical protein V1525DRAFT_432822 [Lipomyces kononenkoae]|uniref:Uncharacterized protein n=1 Tax=Lipomyces kononenkoae TaxID=34357 RepID=A0ACC3T1C4_LIPKO